jgi:hypothetical protein
MAQNKNTLIRYKTIDKCLQNRESSWTLDDLILACSKALSEIEKREVVISKRPVQLDIQMMRDSEVGYNAPIEVFQRKFYRYTDDLFSITKLPITVQDRDLVLENLNVIAQFEGFSFYKNLKQGVDELQKLMKLESVATEEDKVKKITIEVDKSSAEKLLNKPLHKTQKVKKEKKNGNLVLQYKIKKTAKFQKQLLQFGDKVVVISPESLKKEFKKAMSRTKK